MSTVPKNSLTIFLKVSDKVIIGEIFVGEILTRRLQTALLSMFCKIIRNSSGIVKCHSLDPEKTFRGILNTSSYGGYFYPKHKNAKILINHLNHVVLVFIG